MIASVRFSFFALFAACSSTLPDPVDDMGAVDMGAIDMEAIEPSHPLLSCPEWTWENPLPIGPGINAIWGALDDDAWAVGWRGALAHWDGAKWTPLQSPSTDWLIAIAGSGPRDAWAVGGHATVLHFDGTTWSPVPIDLPTGTDVTAVAAPAPGDAWVVAGGALLHWNGAIWRAIDRSEVAAAEALWAGAPGDVWVSDFDGKSYQLRHFDGTRWTTPGGPFDYVSSIWGSAPNDVWAVGGTESDDPHSCGGGFVLHWDGSAWTPPTDPNGLSACPLTQVWGRNAHDVWFVSFGRIFHFDGTTVTLVNVPIDVRVLGGTSHNLWMASVDQFIRWDGTALAQWSNAISGDYYFNAIDAIGGTAIDDLWAAGDFIAHRGADGWTVRPSSDLIQAVYARAKDDVWFAGSTIIHFKGARFTTYHLNDPYLQLVSIWASAADDAWAVGESIDTAIALHWDGTSWNAVALPEPANGLSSVWGSAADDVWLVGGLGGRAAYHWDGHSLSVVRPPPPADYDNGVTGIWGTSRTDVWALGKSSVFHWEGSQWTTLYSTDDKDVFFDAIAGTSTDDVWVSSIDGRVFHWNGSTWQTSVVPGVDIEGLFALDSAHVWVTGAWAGSLYRHCAK